jgi:signal transduction histidine kinase/ligand-binding sensor domain-containing protein
MRHSLPALLSLAVAAFLTVSAPANGAAAVTDGLSNYNVTSWTQRNGLPPSRAVWAIAQDLDGFVWVGTDEGLFRFDGARFIPWGFLGSPDFDCAVRSLLVSSDGSIWVGCAQKAGVGRIRAAGISWHGTQEGFPPAPVTALAEDHGKVYAGTTKGLFTFSNASWQPATPNGADHGHVLSLATEAAGTVVVTSARGIFTGQTFERLNLVAPLTEFHLPNDLVGAGLVPYSAVSDREGRLLLADWTIGFRVFDGPPLTTPSPGRGHRLLIDHQQNLWVGTVGQGLWLVPGPAARTGRVERAVDSTGLPSNTVLALFEDRDENVWAGTTEGLSRIRKNRFRRLRQYGVVSSIASAPGGDVWLSTSEELIRVAPAHADTSVTRLRLLGAFKAMSVASNGHVWVATDKGLSHASATDKLLMPVPGTSELRYISVIVATDDGSVWLNDRHKGLFQWNGTLRSVAHTIRNGEVASLHEDWHGQLWIGLANSEVGILDRTGAFHAYRKEDGIDIGVVQVFHTDRSGTTWLGGSRGLARYDAGHFRTLANGDGSSVDHVSALIEDDFDNFWLLTGDGLVRVNKTELSRVMDGRSRAASFVQLGSLSRTDGIAGRLALDTGSHRRGIRVNNGQLWFVGWEGLTVADPSTTPESNPPVPVKVDYVRADDNRIDSAIEHSLPANTTRIDISYTDLNVTSTLRTRFRYRLDGFDTDWVEAGARRQVSYANLAPRAYTFRVMASRVDDVWNGPETSWAFNIQPRFTQTWAFYALIVASGALTVWGAWHLRIRQIRRQYLLLLRERVRLSRELHDTLLQGLAGMAMQFDAVAADVHTSGNQMVAVRLARMRKQAEDYIREARQSIWDLRSPQLERCKLSDALNEAGQRIAESKSVEFQLAVSGNQQPYARRIEEHLLRIGQEAVSNAVRHSSTATIRMELIYDDDQVTLRVSDDGCGFDKTRIGNAGREHYGLASMRERAEEVGGVFELLSAIGHGTVVTVTVPVTTQARAISA